MKTARITWNLPTVRASGGPLTVQELSGVRVEFSADQGANFVELITIPATDPQEHLIPDLEDGTWMVRLTVIDTDTQESLPVDTPFTIDSSAPGVVTNVVVQLS